MRFTSGPAARVSSAEAAGGSQRRPQVALAVGCEDVARLRELSSDAAPWAVLHVHGSQELQDALRDARVRVGLVHIRPPASRPEEVKALLQESTALFWIALVERGALDSPEWRRVVLEWCYDYHTLPLDSERLRVVLGHVQGVARLRALEVGQAPPHLVDRGGLGESGEEQMVGTSPVIREVFAAIRRCAVGSAPVLISGESGTGKELTARAVHERSDFAQGPFVVVSCGTMSKELARSELFGHVQGAFAGATQDEIGMLEKADGGSLLLDEVGDLSLDLQAALVRFLEKKTVQAVGSTTPRLVNVQIITSTRLDLRAAVKAGRFRDDLFYRLNVLRIDLPPLRARGDDIDVLAQFFFRRFERQIHSRCYGFSEAARAAMRAHGWPGNVRELINRIRRALVMCRSRLIEPEDLELTGGSRSNDVQPLGAVRAAAERAAVRRALETSPSVSEAARRLEITRTTLYQLMRKYDVRESPVRASAGTVPVARLSEALEANGYNVSRTARALGISRRTLYERMRRSGIQPGKPHDSEVA